MARWKAGVDFLLSVIALLFTACRTARIASAVLAITIPSLRPSVRLSVLMSVTRRYCVKTTKRRMLQSSLKERKNVSSFPSTKKDPDGLPFSPEMLAQTDPRPPESSEF